MPDVEPTTDVKAVEGPDSTGPADGHDSITVGIREADAGDLETLAALLAEIMVHHGAQPPPGRALRETLQAVLASPTHLFLVAEAGDTIIGACSLIISISTWSAGLVCEVQDVIVRSRDRDSGVGRRLLDAASAVAAERGCVRLFLYAEPFNLGAHAFYRSLGLTEKTALYFERSLDPTAT